MTVPTALALAEQGLIPTPLLRAGIRRLLRRRLRQESARSVSLDSWAGEMAGSEIATSSREANAQHYELPPDFFRLVLGPRLKYSSAFWPDGVTTLAAAEEAMLDLTSERARLMDGQRILELGCGWGSLSLYMAARFPTARILAVSNSHQQREFITARARSQGLTNLSVHTADMNDFAAPGRFDRVVSVEMFEHMRNWAKLLHRIREWLETDGALFVHVFAHVRFAYPFETTAQDDWMGRHFFTGGMMPSDRLLPHVAGSFEVEGHWRVPGTHYARTAEAWHDQLMGRRHEVQALLSADIGRREAVRAYNRWRLFFLACAELFAYQRGTEWLVSHYRLRPAAERMR